MSRVTIDLNIIMIYGTLQELYFFFLGQPQDFDFLYFEVKHMFLYRDPVKNIVSILSMAGSMPKFITQKFIGRFMNKMVSGLSPDLLTEKMALNQITKSLEGGDDQVFAVVLFILHILCYLKGKSDTGIKPHTIKYEKVVNNPREELEKIVYFLGKENGATDYESCLEAMKKDSQGKSEVLSKAKLASVKKKNPITQELTNKIDKFFSEFGLPKTNEFDGLF